MCRKFCVSLYQTTEAEASRKEKRNAVGTQWGKMLSFPFFLFLDRPRLVFGFAVSVPFRFYTHTHKSPSSLFRFLSRCSCHTGVMQSTPRVRLLASLCPPSLSTYCRSPTAPFPPYLSLPARHHVDPLHDVVVLRVVPDRWENMKKNKAVSSNRAVPSAGGFINELVATTYGWSLLGISSTVGMVLA